MHVAFSWDPSIFNFRHMLGNPYGGLLVEAMQRHGYSFELISLNPGRDTPSVNLGWIWRNRGRVHGIHLHWLQGITNTDTATKAWLRMGAFVASLLLARLLGYRIIWTLHNMLPHERPHWGVDVVGRYVMALLANSIICHCEYAARRYTRRFKRRRNLFVIPHGDFRNAYPAEVSREEARRELGIPETPSCTPRSAISADTRVTTTCWSPSRDLKETICGWLWPGRATPPTKASLATRS